MTFFKRSVTPEISITEWKSMMSPVPIYRVESPGRAAVEEIMSLGRPNGSDRMTSVAMRDPVDPPMAITPSNFPCPWSSLAIWEAPWMVILVILDRSLDAWISSRLLPPASAT